MQSRVVEISLLPTVVSLIDEAKTTDTWSRLSRKIMKSAVSVSVDGALAFHALHLIVCIVLE